MFWHQKGSYGMTKIKSSHMRHYYEKMKSYPKCITCMLEIIGLNCQAEHWLGSIWETGNRFYRKLGPREEIRCSKQHQQRLYKKKTELQLRMDSMDVFWKVAMWKVVVQPLPKRACWSQSKQCTIPPVGGLIKTRIAHTNFPDADLPSTARGRAMYKAR